MATRQFRKVPRGTGDLVAYLDGQTPMAGSTSDEEKAVDNKTAGVTVNNM